MKKITKLSGDTVISNEKNHLKLSDSLQRCKTSNYWGDIICFEVSVCALFIHCKTGWSQQDKVNYFLTPSSTYTSRDFHSKQRVSTGCRRPAVEREHQHEILYFGCLRLLSRSGEPSDTFGRQLRTRQQRRKSSAKVSGVLVSWN